MSELQALAEAVRFNVARVIVGKPDVIDDIDSAEAGYPLTDSDMRLTGHGVESARAATKELSLLKNVTFLLSLLREEPS